MTRAHEVVMPALTLQQREGHTLSLSSRLGLLGALYLAQGLPYGFFTQALPAVMRQQGVSLSLIGLSSLFTLPWALKFLWAPVLDHYYSDRIGRRKTWILPLQGLAVIAMVGLAFVDAATQLHVILIGFLLANFLAATQDIATDGLAIDLLKVEERGMGNGVQVAGYRVGMIIGGGALLVAYGTLGWRWTFLVMAGLLACTTLPLWGLKENAAPRAMTAPETTQAKGWFWRSLWTFMTQPKVLPWLAVLLLYKAGDAMATGMLRPFLIDLGWRLQDLGWMLGSVGFTAGLFGALVGGWGVQALGRQKALLGFGLFQALAVGLYALPAMGLDHTWLLYVICGLEHFAGGMATAALFTIMMDLCRPEQAATDYTLQASLAVMAKGIFTATSGFSAATLGFAGHFVLAGVFCLIGLGAAWLWFRTSNQQQRGE